VYHWELDGSAIPEFDDLSLEVRKALSAFMDAVVIVDPLEYQRDPGEIAAADGQLRTLYFGIHHQGLVTFLVYEPDELVLVVRIQWLGE
jgi:hypothetical protein